MNINSGRVRMLNGNSSCCRPLQGDLDLHIKRLRVCLVEWVLGRMKKKNLRRENFLECLFGRGEREKNGGSWDPPKSFLPKMGSKLGREKF